MVLVHVSTIYHRMIDPMGLDIPGDIVGQGMIGLSLMIRMIAGEG